MITNEDAIGLFVQEFAQSKSLTHPYIATKHGHMWVLQDGPGKKGHQRKIQVIADRMSPEETVAQVSQLGLGWHFIEYFHKEGMFDEMRAKFKSLGYRAMISGSLFVHDHQNIPVLDSEPMPRLVDSQELMDSIPQRAGQKQKLRPGIRQYCVWDEKSDRGWVQSIPFGDIAWTANLYVFDEFQKRGYGAALMSKVLLDDKRLGCRGTVLLASAQGARLYRRLNFEERCVRQVFCPVKRSA
jgi:GNAT superfamily N-acetyltransferase